MNNILITILLAFGLCSGTLIAGAAQDKIYAKLSVRNGGKGQPEFRLLLVQLGMCVFPLGQILFGWPAQAHAHWIIPQFGSAIFCLGLMLAFTAIQNFLVDYCGLFCFARVRMKTTFML